MIVNAGYRGKVGAAVPKFTYTGQYNTREDGVVELLTSGTITFLSPTVIDIFCVGGGGAGSFVAGTKSGLGSPGGGGGYTKTALKQTVTGSYTVTIGAGGVANSTGPNNGQETSFGSVLTAAGGKSRGWGLSQNFSGGDGGSGGGGGVSSNSDYGVGGYDGSNGEGGYPTNSSHAGGIGQGYTTREFGEQTGKLYAGGGGGGRYLRGSTAVISPGGAGGGGSGSWVGSGTSQAASAGVANTGGGGGGGSRGSVIAEETQQGAAGGSGIVCLRMAK